MLYYNIPPAPTLTLPGRSFVRLVDSIKPVLQELRGSGRVEGPSHKPYLNLEYPTFFGLLIVMISLYKSAKTVGSSGLR